MVNQAVAHYEGIAGRTLPDHLKQTMLSEHEHLARSGTAVDPDHFLGRLHSYESGYRAQHAEGMVDRIAQDFPHAFPTDDARHAMRREVREIVRQEYHPGMAPEHVEQAVQDYHKAVVRGHGDPQAYLRERLKNAGEAQAPFTPQEAHPLRTGTPYVEPPPPLPSLEAKKRKGLGSLFSRDPEKTLDRAVEGVDKATVEAEAAKRAFEAERDAAKELAADMRQKAQQVKAAQDKVAERTANGATPQALKEAQQESLAAQRELIESKKKLNAAAKRVAESKQGLNTFSKNAEKAEYELQKAQRRLTPNAVAEPTRPLEIGEVTPEGAKKGTVGRKTFERLADKDTALDARRRDLDSAQARVTRSERDVARVNTQETPAMRKANATLESARQTHGEAGQAVDRLRADKTRLVEALQTAGTPADRAALTKQVARHDAAISEALTKQRQAQRAMDGATRAAEKAGKPLAQAQAQARKSYDAAHQATANGKYANTATSDNHIAKEAARTKAAEKAARAAQRAEQKALRQAQRLEQRALREASRANKPGLLSRLWRDDSTVRALGRTEQAVATTVAAAEHQGPGLLRRIGGSLAKNGGGAIGAMSKTANGFTRNLLVAGAVGGGLLALASMMNAPKPVLRRTDDFGSNGLRPEEDMPMVFKPNPNVGVGALAVPQMGQQQQMGSWVSRLPSLEDSIAMGSQLPPAPGR